MVVCTTFMESSCLLVTKYSSRTSSSDAEWSQLKITPDLNVLLKTLKR